MGVSNQTIIQILLEGGTLTILVVSLDILAGLTGRLSMAQGALYGIGAYGLGIMTTRYGIPFLPALLIGVVGAAVVGAVIAVASSRASHFYLAIATLAVQQILVEILGNLGWTGGSAGIFGIQRVGQLTDQDLALVICGVALLTLIGDLWVSRRFLGLRLRAVRDDQALAEAYGYRVQLLVVVSFAISGALCGLAGALYATTAEFIDPSSFGVNESFVILMAFIVGGRGPLGSFLGAFLFVIVEQLLRIPNFSGEFAGTVPQVVYGGFLVLVIAFMPGGASGLVGRVGRRLRMWVPRRRITEPAS
jgi:branched-chain amino acid transport system permease protein